MFRIIAILIIYVMTLRYYLTLIGPNDPHPLFFAFGYLGLVCLLVSGFAQLYRRWMPRQPEPVNFSYLPSPEGRAQQTNNLLNWIILLLLLLLCRGI